ncbi:MAG: hypothetical protein AAFQ42_00455, partial [Pseudomonadota bacterium]
GHRFAHPIIKPGKCFRTPRRDNGRVMATALPRGAWHRGHVNVFRLSDGRVVTRMRSVSLQA